MQLNDNLDDHPAVRHNAGRPKRLHCSLSQARDGECWGLSHLDPLGSMCVV